MSTTYNDDDRTDRLLHNIDEAILSANNQIKTEAAQHEKRLEFWRGYRSAMNEIREWSK